MKKLIIKPFNDFWLNCLFNHYFSIICSINDSYREMAYINNYIYRTLNEWAPKHIELELDNLEHKSYVKKTFKKKLIYMEYSDKNIQKMLKCLNKENLLLRVELYNWLPNTSAWKRKHEFHFSLITHYDYKTKKVVVIDDDFYSYGEKEVPYERFKACIRSEEGYIIGYRILPRKRKNKQLNIRTIIKNSKRLIRNINKIIKEEDIWCEKYNEKGECLYEYYAFEIHKIVNRQIANTMLIKCLFDKGVIEYAQYKELIEKIEDIKKGWEKIKFIFLLMQQREKYKNDKSVLEINLIKEELLKKEIIVWGRLARILK